MVVNVGDEAMNARSRLSRLSYVWLSLLVPLVVIIYFGQLATPVSLAAVSATYLDVVISEIAWMGTTTASSDEWLELLNNTSSVIDLTDWQLVSNDGAPAITLSGIIPANGRFLLERTDDTSTLVLADQIYSGSLLNSGEVLTLTDNFNQVVDVANAPGGWLAGDNMTKETIERTSPMLAGNLSASWDNGHVNGNPANSIQDNDGDTFGFSPNITWVAGDGSGYAAFAEDCDDTDNAIYPGAPELLDVKDNDCDGEIDENFVLGDLNYAVYSSSDTALTTVGPTTDTTAMEAALLNLISQATQTVDVTIYGLV